MVGGLKQIRSIVRYVSQSQDDFLTSMLPITTGNAANNIFVFVSETTKGR